MSTLRYSFKGLRTLQTRLAELEKRAVKIGLLASTAHRTPTESDRINHNPSLGAIHEFGLSYTVRKTGSTVTIPERSFLRMPLTQHFGEVTFKSGASWADILMLRGSLAVLQQLGKAGERTIQEAFDTKGWGQWPPLSKLTIWKKKRNRTAILIETEQLRRAITSQVV